MGIRLFIADTDEEHIRRTVRGLARCPDMRVIGTGGNGAHVLRQLSLTPADVLITEIQLPGLDGIMLLKDLQSLRVSPSVIVCTHFYSPICVSRAWACGASYFLYKPLDYNRLPEIIRECHAAHMRVATDAPLSSADDHYPQRREAIRALLAEAGMPARLTGSLYLYEALMAAGEEPTLLKNLSKGLYAEVARRTQSTPQRLERALRNAIAIACDRSGLDRRFGHCPSNREFILYLMERLQERSL